MEVGSQVAEVHCYGKVIWKNKEVQKTSARTSCSNDTTTSLRNIYVTPTNQPTNQLAMEVLFSPQDDIYVVVPLLHVVIDAEGTTEGSSFSANQNNCCYTFDFPTFNG